MGKGLEYDLVPPIEAYEEWKKNNSEEAMRIGIFGTPPVEYKSIDNFYMMVFPNRVCLQIQAEKGKEIKAKSLSKKFINFDRSMREMRYLRDFATRQSPRSDDERIASIFPEYREEIVRRQIEREIGKEGELDRGVSTPGGKRIAS